MTLRDLVGHGRMMRLAIPIGLTFLCAVVLGWYAGDTPVPPAARPAPVPWSLPQPEVRDSAKDLAIVTAGRPWNRGTGAAAAGATPTPAAPAASWRVAGIVLRNDQRFALIANGLDATAKLDYLSVGDALPDGSVLVEITPDSAAVEGGKTSAAGRRIYRLFDKKK
jgi:hypothetical protein